VRRLQALARRHAGGGGMHRAEEWCAECHVKKSGASAFWADGVRNS